MNNALSLDRNSTFQLQLVRSFNSQDEHQTKNPVKSDSKDKTQSETIEEVTAITTKKTTKSSNLPKSKRSLITRTNLYKTIERKLNTLVFL